ncbi:hypothetical protein FQA39_LY05212 [Lamprigera yunnana]|nr:hypothetical protein FQA39_LY05212 [Lamprigera yunnana]
MDHNIRKIPVFVFPTTLNFYLNARNTHKQLLTLYNPYDFPVRFKVLCTAPSRYTVIDPDGSIGPQACVDIVVRHMFPILANCNTTDKFRITMQDHATRQTLGKRDVEAKLFQGEPDNSSNDGENFVSLPIDRTIERSPPIPYQYNLHTPQRLGTTSSVNYLAIFAGIISIFALLLPTREEKQEFTSIPLYLHVSINLKLVFAYVLGLTKKLIVNLDTTLTDIIVDQHGYYLYTGKQRVFLRYTMRGVCISLCSPELQRMIPDVLIDLKLDNGAVEEHKIDQEELEDGEQ